jgi:ATP-dependent helicase HrpA
VQIEPNPFSVQLDLAGSQIEQCMLTDRRKLRSRHHHLAAAIGHARLSEQRIERLAADVARSVGRAARRREGLPRPAFPSSLPVVERREDIARAIIANQVIVLTGETGSGKTTQIPKICLELGRGVFGMIGHTQPRRIAARFVAMRIAEELKTNVGQAVGYKVRFTDHVRPDTYVKLMTDGILLAETQRDQLLDQYDTLIIDEAHERSLNIDFLLGYLKHVLPRRPDLKLIIMSATIDPQRFSRHFNDAPIVEVSGRTFPVETRYRPLQTDNEDEEDRQMPQGILDAIDELWREGPGDVLVFLPGEREIRETAEALRKHHLPEQDFSTPEPLPTFRAGSCRAGPGRHALRAGSCRAGPGRHAPALNSSVEILPMYARLGAEEQQRIFQPHDRPRIVLATNVAETSLTVPGIRYVIDSGHARVSRYSARTRVQRLPIEKISRASVDQRKGRCGRVGPGVCIRLFSEADYDARSQFTDPEILRTNLASVILQMKAFGLGTVEDFPFLDPPDYRMIRDGFQTLHELGAIDEENRLTEIGRSIARLPIDPRIARMILAAREERVLPEVLIIASALSIDDPRERPMDQRDAADAAHAQFRDPKSDFLAYLKLWDWYHEHAHHLSQSKLRKLCRETFLSYVRLREWHDVHSQLHAIMNDTGPAHISRRKAYKTTSPSAGR